MSCGMVRKVDELGRVVIPKEMRRVLNIKTGSSIEIFINDCGEITLKKFSEVSNISSFAESMADIIFNSYNIPCLVCDDEKVLICRGVSKKEFLDKNVYIKSKDDFFVTDKKIIQTDDQSFEYSFVYTLKSDGFDCGYIILLHNSNNLEDDILKSIKLLCQFLTTLLRF